MQEKVKEQVTQLTLSSLRYKEENDRLERDLPESRKKLKQWKQELKNVSK